MRSYQKICQMTAKTGKNRLFNSYRNTISKWAMVVRRGNLLVPQFKNPGDEEISIPDNRPIPKSYIYACFVFAHSQF